MLNDLVDQLDNINPDAAKSLREGLDETLTVQRLELPELLRISLRSTNAVESINSAIRDRSHTSNTGATATRSNGGLRQAYWKMKATSDASKGIGTFRP